MNPADDEPLTLLDVCEIVFRNKITPWTLKAEIKRGNLKAFKLGRRYFTTIAHARELQQCLAVENRPDFTFTRKGTSGLSETDRRLSAQAALRSRFEKPKRLSGNISGQSTNQKARATH